MGGQHRKTDRHMTEVDLGVASHSSDMKLAAQLCVTRVIHVETVERAVSRTRMDWSQRGLYDQGHVGGSFGKVSNLATRRFDRQSVRPFQRCFI